jgi:hypothetical protein
MSDQCRHCMVRGDIEWCRATECFHHESWYATEIEQEISILRAEVNVLRRYRPQFLNKPLFSKEAQNVWT